VIRSTPFGGVTLTGEDAAAFLRQIEEPDGEQVRRAQQSLEHGLKLLREFEERQ
jgi:hypothetical protein